MKQLHLPAATLCVAVALAASCAAQVPSETWGLVSSIVGPNIVLDDGQLIRLQAQTAITKADGSAGKRVDINRGCRLVVTRSADGTVAQVKVFVPSATRQVFLSNTAPARGAAYVTTVQVGGSSWSRSLALLRATYTRPATYTQFRSQVRYDPRGLEGAPAAARFMLKDSFGDVIVERVLTAGGTAHLNTGLDAQATDRITLETAPAGEGMLAQEACLWLDPRFVLGTPAATPMPISKDASTKVAEALAASLGETKLGAVAVCDFKPVRPPKDQSFIQDLSRDLMVLLGKKYRLAGHYRKQLDPGTPLTDADKKELQKLQATHVVTGSVNWRQEGVIINAVMVQVDNGALMAAVSVRD